MDPNIFREYDIRGIVGSQLSDDTVAIVARAIGTYFRQNNAKRIAVGFDARESSSRFCEILISKLNESGCGVVKIGMVPTPVLYHTVYTKNVQGGVMITGSHNPPDHNGFKICLGKQTLFGKHIQEIRAIADQQAETRAVASVPRGAQEMVEVRDDYIADVSSGFSLGSRKLKIVIDAGNGMGGVTAVPVYRKLGVEVVELFTDPDPTFPNHDPDPSVEENFASLIAAVRENNADVGFAFDGDGDRLGVIDETGEIWWGDKVLTLFAREVLATQKGATVIAEAKCSQTLFDDIEKHGGKSVMSKAGHSIIKAEMQKSGALLGGEMSGHFFFADRYYGFDDACYAGARLLEILSKTDKPLSKMLADLPVTFSTPEIRVECSDEKKFAVAEKIAEHFARTHSVNTIDGARITFENGWGIVRPSNTRAMLVLRFEADTQNDLDSIRERVESKVREFIG